MLFAVNFSPKKILGHPEQFLKIDRWLRTRKRKFTIKVIPKVHYKIVSTLAMKYAEIKYIVVPSKMVK